MQRRVRGSLPRTRRVRTSALSWAAVLALAPAAFGVQAQAQSRPPAGSPTDVRHAPVWPPAADAPSALVREGVNADGAQTLVKRIVVEADRNAVPADGVTPVKFVLSLLDAEDRPLNANVFVTIETSGGRLLLPGARTDELGPRGADADRAMPGVQLRTEFGSAEFTLIAPTQAQEVRVRVTAGSVVASGSVSFVPELRPMVAAGLLEGVVALRRGLNVQPLRRGDAFEQDIRAWERSFSGGEGQVAARAAFYLKGVVRGDVLLTAAYDSDKDTRTRLLRDIRPDEFYPVYGDSSLKSFDARSGSKLFVRLDKDKHFLLWGDFATGDGFAQPLGQGALASLKQRSLGSYNRSATGLRLHAEQERYVANAFVIRDTLRQAVDEFASQGSGPYALRNGAVLEGSEKVEVLVRDRSQPARILSVRPLQRLVDYSFEPFSGRIVLASFLPSVDTELNPVSLRVSYEVDQGGEPFWVGGVDGQLQLGRGLEIGGSFVSDRNALAPYELASANLTWKLGERTAIVAELAQTTSTVNTNPANQNTNPGLANFAGEAKGRAARLEWVHEGERADARVFLGRPGAAWHNPSAPLNGGRDEFFARGSFKLGEGLKLYGQALKSEDRVAGGGEQSAGAFGVNWKAGERLSLDLSLRRSEETIGSRNLGYVLAPFGSTEGLSGSLGSGAAGGALGLGAGLIDPATGLPVIRPGGLLPGTSSLAAGTPLQSTTLRLGAGWRVNQRLSLGGEIEGDISGAERQRVALGADWQLWERSRLYARAEHQRGWVQFAGVSDVDKRSNQLVFGVDSSYWGSTQLFSEYRLRDAIAGRDLQLASGVRHFWDVREGLRLSSAFEHVRALAGRNGHSNAIAFGADWTANPLWRASGRLEHRSSGDVRDTPDNEAFSTTLIQGTVARKLSRDWTLLARNYTLLTNYSDPNRGEVLQNRIQLGVAFRETDRNRVNALAKLERKFESDASNPALGTLRSMAWIASTHADWHPSRPWWLTGRLASKWQKDQFERGVRSNFKAVLASGRVVYDVTENIDLGLMGAMQFGQNGARQGALGVEAGYLLTSNLWLSMGVNTAGFWADADLAGYEYTQRGAYIRLRFKFDETLFKGRDREVNRSLDR
jgi:hypothetical protein